ncbi:hypothetical protein ATANTOWER_023840 [Ataeniobius toweri]|uniref:Uncharacterized protein n=1 Tax=Ataeniobius toweri TaxID=208326 RepID=A0ABU7B1X4_9TELE|nr:hypothetical protein [Ataeniobius toweri]
MYGAYGKTPYWDLYHQQADTLFSPEHDESFNTGSYHPPSPDLYSPTTSSSQLSESLFSPGTPTGYNLRSYHLLSPELYSPLCVAESADTDIRPEDKRVVMENEATTSYSPSPKTLDPIPDPQPSRSDLRYLMTCFVFSVFSLIFY